MRFRDAWLCLVVALVAVPPSAAQTGESQRRPPPANYYPLQVGNKWHYRVVANGVNGNCYIHLAAIDEIAGIKAGRLEAVLNGNTVATEHVGQTAEGVFRYRNNGVDISPPFCMLKYPPKDGDKWEGQFNAGGMVGKFQCQAHEVEVEVPAGKFKAVRIDMKVQEGGTSATTSYWFADGVGMVRQTIEIPNLNILMELERFEPKK